MAMTLDNQRIMQGSLYVTGLLAGFVISKFGSSIADLTAPNLMLVGGFSLVQAIEILSFGAGLAAAEVARRHPVANAFFGDVIGELKKVTWPNWKEVRGATTIVLIMTFAVAVLLFILDKIFDFGLNLLL